MNRVALINQRLQQEYQNTTSMAQTFGIEFEFQYRGDKSLRGLANHLAEQTGESVTALYYSDHCYNDNYNFSTWRLTTDSTAGWELVTPILHGQEGLDRVEKMLEVLNQENINVHRGCGTHVHFGIENTSLKTYANFLAMYSKFERAIDLLQPESRRGNNNQWTRTFGNYDLDTNNLYIKEIKKIKSKQINYNSLPTKLAEYGRRITDKYVKVNVSSYRSKQTVEIRHHAGTTNFHKISTWIKFIDFMFRWSSMTTTSVTSNKHDDSKKLWNALIGKVRVAGETQLAKDLNKRRKELS